MHFNITEYGAIPGGKQLCTQAIQKAIDACSAAGGGKVIIPTGEFLTGGLYVRSNVHIHFENGAVLKVSPDKTHYERVNCVERGGGFVFYANGEKNIFMSGSGTVHGTGEEDFGNWWGIDTVLEFRVGIMLFVGCEHVNIEQVTFLYSDSWTLHFLQCENVWISRVRIINNIYHLNSDGIDPDSCTNFFISDCYIIAGDDCICPKTSVKDAPMTNLVVTNCVLETTTTAIKIGTASYSDFSDMHFSNISIRNSSLGVGFFIKDGAVAERMTFNNISIECADRENIKPVIPIFMDIEKRAVDSAVGRIRDISLTNIMINSASGALIQGMPKSPIENLTVKDLVLRAPKACDLSIRKKAIGGRRTAPDDGRDTRFIRKNAYLAVAHTRGLSLDNITVIAPEDLDMAALYLYDSHDAHLGRIQRTGGAGPVISRE